MRARLSARTLFARPARRYAERVTFKTDTEVMALVLTVAVHVIAAGVLIWGMIDHDDPERGSWRDWWPRDDRGDDPPPFDLGPQPGGGLAEPAPASVVPVLPDSRPAPGRVREGGRIGDLTPRPSRRPSHPEPVPAPQRVPAHDAAG